MDQVRAAWTDDLDLDAPIGYQICQPQPPRGPEEVDISLDIILSQGLHLWRYSGLVTVSFLDDLEGNTRFHVASSFLREVSGYDVVDAVDLHHLCSPIAPGGAPSLMGGHPYRSHPIVFIGCARDMPS